jgi:hypothetical protein
MPDLFLASKMQGKPVKKGTRPADPFFYFSEGFSGGEISPL